MAVWRSEGGAVWDGFVEPGGHRVDFWGGGDRPEGGHALTMFDRESKRGKAELDGEDRDGGGGETVCGPSLDPPPEGVKFILHL